MFTLQSRERTNNNNVKTIVITKQQQQQPQPGRVQEILDIYQYLSFVRLGGRGGGGNKNIYKA